MLGWAITFLLLAIIAGFLGFGGVAGTLTAAAKLLFVAFVFLFVLTLVANLIAGKKINPPI